MAEAGNCNCVMQVIPVPFQRLSFVSFADASRPLRNEFKS